LSLGQRQWHRNHSSSNKAYGYRAYKYKLTGFFEMVRTVRTILSRFTAFQTIQSIQGIPKHSKAFKPFRLMQSSVAIFQ
jgi:hypothetical protein